MLEVDRKLVEVLENALSHYAAFVSGVEVVGVGATAAGDGVGDVVALAIAPLSLTVGFGAVTGCAGAGLGGVELVGELAAGAVVGGLGAAAAAAFAAAFAFSSFNRPSTSAASSG